MNDAPAGADKTVVTVEDTAHTFVVSDLGFTDPNDTPADSLAGIVVTTIPAAGVVGEAMIAFVLADAYRRKFGGDHIEDVKAAVRAYEERIGWRRA